jgi:hypothetical protein
MSDATFNDTGFVDGFGGVDVLATHLELVLLTSDGPIGGGSADDHADEQDEENVGAGHAVCRFSRTWRAESAIVARSLANRTSPLTSTLADSRASPSARMATATVSGIEVPH